MREKTKLKPDTSPRGPVQPPASSDHAADTSHSRRRTRRVIAVIALVCVVIAVAIIVASSGSNNPGHQLSYPTGKRGVTSGTEPSTTTPTSQAPDTDPTAGLSLTFDKTFGGSRLNTSTWSTCYPHSECTNYGNQNEIEWYRPSGAVVSGGVLHLVATKKPTNGTNSAGAPETYPYTSGMITTKQSFSFTYGYVSVVAQIPGGAGTWPALWLLPQTSTWPPEIDIMENFGDTNSLRTTYHWSGSSGPLQSSTNETTSTNLANSYHTYGLLWKPGAIYWYLDGKEIYSFTGSTVTNQPMYFLANLAIDGTAPSPSSFNIKSVKIYTTK